MSNETRIEMRQGLKIPRVFTQNKDPYSTVEYEKRSSIIKNPDGTIVFEMNNIEVPTTWSQVAVDILAQKYFRKAGVPQFDSQGSPILDENGDQIFGSETSVKQVVHRLAGCWRFWGEKYGYFASTEDAQAFYDETVYMLLHQMASPNSPQWFNTGLNFAYNITGPSQGHYYVDPDTKELVKAQDAYTRVQAHACFIQSIRDDLVNEGGIMDLWTREARVFKYGSGTGTNFSNLRGRGEKLSGGGISSGVMSFLKIGDATGGAIKSGGTTRRAAKMVILNMDHPEVEDFITWKANEERKAKILIDHGGYPADYEGEAYRTVSGQNSNNSVRASNKYMDKVINDEEWHLTARTDGKIMKTVQARDLWNKIGEAAWQCADPGVQYDDTINEWHTCGTSGRINATNPCSEYVFLDDTACNLASLNLMKFFDIETQIFDVEAFRHAVRTWTVILEISVLMAHFPSKEIGKRSYEFRTLGLGYTNLGAMLMVSGIPYDSPEALAITGSVSALMTGESYAASAEMASILGPFPRYEENKQHMLRVVRNHRRAAYNAPVDEYEGLSIFPIGINPRHCPTYLLQAATQSWDRAVQMGEKYGYRNAQSTLIAPTGTISLQMDCDTTGIEPDFALVKFKKLAGGGYFKIINRSVEPALRNLGYTEDQIKDIIEYVMGTGHLRGAPHINLVSLAEKGFTKRDIEKAESHMPSSFDIRFVFNGHTLGKDCMERLGFRPEQYNAPGFDLLTELGFTGEQIDVANDHICGTMTIEGAPHLREEHYPVFDCANRCGKKGKRYIPYMAHVRTMAAAQPFLSGAISKTVNMPNEATVEDVLDVYMEAWKLGLKCIAIYRDGSKASQPLSTKTKSAQQTAETKIIEKIIEVPVARERRKMPAERQAITHKFRVGNSEGYVTVGLFEDGTPGELFIHMNKEGSTLAGLMNSFSLVASLALQYGTPLPVLVDKIVHTRFEPMGFTDNPQIKIAKSVMDYIFRWLALKFLHPDDLKKVGINPSDLGMGSNGYSNGTNGYASANAPAEVKEYTPTVKEPPQTEEKKVTDFLKPIPKIEVKKKDFDVQGDAPLCSACGGLMMRSGTCYLCTTCGETSGCS
jgi:ribonucleoside-diphosphate reductase alpha chain